VRADHLLISCPLILSETLSLSLSLSLSLTRSHAHTLSFALALSLGPLAPLLPCPSPSFMSANAAGGAPSNTSEFVSQELVKSERPDLATAPNVVCGGV
jgi:hypothetical protein